jgi:phage baseplate assembly protein gpV
VSRVIDALQAIARHEIDRRPLCELAIVTSVFDGDGADAQSVSLTLKDTGLAIPRVPVVGPLSGEVALPRVGDMVLVLFPRGDLSSALVTGLVYSDNRRPFSATRDEVGLEWPSGTDDPDAKTVRITTAGGDAARKFSITFAGDIDAMLTLTDGTLEFVAGKVKLKMSHSSDSDGAVEISAGETKVSMAQDGDVSIESAGNLTLKGKKVAISVDNEVTINGQKVEIN